MDPVDGDNEPSTSQEPSPSMTVEKKEGTQESAQFVEPKAGSSQETSDIDMKGKYDYLTTFPVLYKFG